MLSTFKFRGGSQPRLELVLACFHLKELLALPFSAGRFVNAFNSVYNFHGIAGFSRWENSGHISALLLLFCTL